MTIFHLSHIAIAVRDTDKVLPFWTELVGLRVTLDSVEEVPAGEGTNRRRAVYLRDSHGPHEAFIVLDELLSGPSKGEAKDLFEIGVHHFGFWVEDVNAIAGRMQAAGVPVVIGPVDSPSDRYGEPLGTFVRTLLVRDPEGNVIQFDQRVNDRELEGASA
ncbi:catechol 2,3-dioxygenase-like lactoylglutathione lyase family enzyme [Paenarthrobacter nitroguajacolicus]|uniref:VOC family protein n=1 Tax=Paenarthrobacter nitroguajacolicus TaxID=211146 RepID=UPI0028581D64|nr:VOC family protein [Paenarthrobacter nitroguajacolicus]MDR6989188.1 catechol 2,3-dioxygenase-like lactoylglutathione lyase family enzyme [Paenarthrobacter nitroguajacolicus]